MVLSYTPRIRSLTVEMPVVLINGLNDASLKFDVSKADIVRSIVYDFLTSAGVLQHNEDLNGHEDRLIEPVGRSPVLLSSE